MKLYLPVKKEIAFGERLKINGVWYNIPEDVDWMQCNMSERFKTYDWAAFIVFLILMITLPMANIFLMVMYALYRLQGKKTAMIAVQFLDGVYLRGYTEEQQEVQFASQYQVGQMPEDVKVNMLPKKKAQVLRIVK